MEHDAITEKIVVRYTAIAIKSNKPLMGQWPALETSHFNFQV